MPLLKLTCRFRLNILVNCCGSEAVPSDNCAVPYGTPAGTLRYYPTLFRNLPRSIPPRPARTETGSSEKTFNYVFYR
jgi:hypothetical protein